ncbi:MAG: SDR family oxidoreductase [Aigarchaeota archaeon]|nr:SDR family oxidoreductase [Aigarchaeota archaeon]MDW8092648.1 SDR family oxidoreductase [Nitrososphaerota archaeon]
MRVFVTGGAGYIGSTLVRLLLNRGYDVVVLDRFFFGTDSLEGVKENVKMIRGDTRWFDPDVLRGSDAVIDLAALSNDPSGELDPEKTLDINYRGRLRVATLAKKLNVKRYVLASSCSVYGFQDGILSEESPVNPLTTYGKANLLAENEILPLADRAFCPTALRLATVYGLSYRMRFDLAINGMVRSLYMTGTIPVMRDGTQWRPFVHVKDAASAFIKVLESSEDEVVSQVFNVGSDEQNVQILQLAKIVAEACGQEARFEWYGSPDRRSYRVSFSKIRNVLRYRTHFEISREAKEIHEALKSGILNPDDRRWITVDWYKHILEDAELARRVSLNGVIL